MALLVFLPNVVWQMEHQWVSLRFIREHGQVIAAEDGRITYVLGQVLLAGPALLPLMALGGYWLFRQARFRSLAWAAALVEGGFLLGGGKAYYPGPIYTLLLAAGAVWFEQRYGVKGSRWTAGLATAVALPSVLLLPLAMPVLPPAALARATPL